MTSVFEIVGVDIDLRRCHAWSSTRGKLCYKASLAELVKVIQDSSIHATFVVECASPHIWGAKENQGMVYNKLRWTIWNSYAIGVLSTIEDRRLFVSPSSTWKHSWQEDEMMKILGIKGDNHDIRQCRAMVAMNTMHPKDWIPINTFMEKL